MYDRQCTGLYEEAVWVVGHEAVICREQLVLDVLSFWVGVGQRV